MKHTAVVRSPSAINVSIHIKSRLARYGSSLVLIWSAIAFYQYNPYYIDFLTQQTQTALFLLASTYSILGLLFYALVPFKKLPDNKAYLALRPLYRASRQWGTAYKVERSEKIAILFLLVKLFFLPLMINSLLSNYYDVQSQLSVLGGSDQLLSFKSFNQLLYPLLFSLLFMIDTLCFTIGYSTEASWLDNKVRSVDTTVSGWLVCLICYPPFNGVLSGFTSWHADETNRFEQEWLTSLLYVGVVLCLMIYVSASLALGTRASNLTNRGIVRFGPYRYVRHPAYISKNLSWWLLMLPVINLPVLLGMAAWSVVYYLRAITEELHLGQDPDYVAYCQQVPARFIPRLRLSR